MICDVIAGALWGRHKSGMRVSSGELLGCLPYGSGAKTIV